MSSHSEQPLLNGSAHQSHHSQRKMDALNEQLMSDQKSMQAFHGDELIGDKRIPSGFIAGLKNSLSDFQRVFTFRNAPDITKVVGKMLAGGGLDIEAGAQLIGSLSNDSKRRAAFIESQVQAKYDKMLHPPLTYLGDAFQYRTVDGKFNSALHPHLGQAGAPYAKTVPSKTHQLGALPDPGDLFDKLMSRKPDGRVSESGLSSMLIYHATIIIHDIFRTNTNDKNISDSSSYLDLSPLYGYTESMQREVRDSDYKLGLLKPDTFAEDRLLRQPPGVCIYLVMYNRYHNYAATQLRRINENGRFSVPTMYGDTEKVSIAKHFVGAKNKNATFYAACTEYGKAWKEWMAGGKIPNSGFDTATLQLDTYITAAKVKDEDLVAFKAAYAAAWNKLDDDLFHTARLITCGIYIQISIHDYLRALMGFHQFDSDFTLDPRINMTDHKNVSRGLGNQVTVEFNLLYRFHCAISMKDEKYAEDLMKDIYYKLNPTAPKDFDPKEMSLPLFLKMMQDVGEVEKKYKPAPSEQTFGIPDSETHFTRNPITNLFDDQQMIDELNRAMDDPISNFGPRNVPRSLRSVEIMGILQARKWEIGTLNDFRDFFGLKRHDSFASISGSEEIQNALRDLYEHPDKVELYPGIFCESDSNMGVDPGPSEVDSALWAAIFSDAITLVRSDRFYTVDWNTNSLTSWGMKEVTPDSNVLKSSVYHRLLQRAFPEWYPYNSIHFFHPFYTTKKNLQYAREQNYVNDFKLNKTPVKNSWGRTIDHEYDTRPSMPQKPPKPLYLDDFDDIVALMADKSDHIVHPARLTLNDLPDAVRSVLVPGQPRGGHVPHGKEIEVDSKAVTKYLMGMMRDIVMRETIKMNEDKKAPVYQIDITRDFAIPVTTRYVADFLGFGHQVRSDRYPKAPYTENEIYQHVTNCQMFLSYNPDETKLLKRRVAFRQSMKFLFDLTRTGNVLEANRWTATRWIRNGVRYVLSFGRAHDNALTALGLKVAERVLMDEGDFDKATAILLLIALDSAYNSVLSFTSVLDHFIQDLYNVAKPGATKPFKQCQWLHILEIAFDESKKASKELTTLVLNAQRASVQLPVIRKATETREIRDKNGKYIFSVNKHQTIICDVHVAEGKHTGGISEEDYLTYRSSFTQKFANYHPKHIAVLSLTAMVRVVAQMKNARRGHDAQGRLKRVKLDGSYEGYSNFMAPMRMQAIEQKVLEARQSSDKKMKAAADKVFTKEILKPQTQTYLTPEWDEMLPFPYTWKIRFDGFGDSEFVQGKFDKLAQLVLPDYVPPFYQPQGASHIGGTFAETVCVCNIPGRECKCKESTNPAKDDGKKKDQPTPPVPSKKALSHGCSLGG